MDKSNPKMENHTDSNPNKCLFVYNLVFPYKCRQFTVSGYTFKQGKENIEVELPQKEKKSIISWADGDASALHDVLLLLSLFTEREVFVSEKPIKEDEIALIKDCREYQFGLLTAIPSQECEDQFGERYNCGLERVLNSVYKHIRAREWKKQYGDGRYLTLYRSACRRQILETSFIISWTIWEILFTLHNQSWLSKKQIEKLPASEKISYVITKYQIKSTLDPKERKGIKRFCKIRNTLIHNGHFVDKKAVDDAILFARVTSVIIAITLGLSGSNALGSQDKLMARFRGEEISGIWSA